MLRILYTSSLLFLVFLAKAQPFNYYSFNELYGFESTTIYSIKQDAQSYIWLATDNGLFKFDGADFEQFVHPNFDKEYTNIKIDSEQNIWFTNFGGQLFRLCDNKIQTVYSNPKEKYFLTNYFLLDSTHVMVVADRGKKFVYHNLNDSQKSKIIHRGNDIIRTCRSTTNNTIIETVTFENGSDSSFLTHRSFDLKTKSFISKHRHYRKPGTIYKMKLFNVGDRNYLSYTSKDHFIIRIDSNVADTLHRSLNTGNLRINNIGSDSEGVYIQKQGKLIRLNLLTGESQMLMKDFDFSCTFKDRENNLWVGTLNQGILIIPQQTISSQKLSSTAIVKAFISKYGKSYFYDVKSNLKTSVVLNQSRPKLIRSKSTHTPLIPHYDDLLLSNANNRIDTTSDQIYEANYSQLYIKNIASINRNYGYITSSDGLYLLKLGNNAEEPKSKFDTFDFGKSNWISVYKTRANLLAFSFKKKNLYVGFINGLKHYDLQSEFTNILYDEKPLFATALESAQNGAWCATSDEYLHRIEGLDVVKSIKTPEQIKNIAKWKEYLFLASKKTLYKVDSNLKKLQTFTGSDGYARDGIKAMQVIGDSLYLIGNHLLQKFHCSKNHQPIPKPVLHIKNIKSNEEVIPSDDLMGLKPYQNDLSIEFDAINISAQQRINYLYRIKEDDKWKKLPYNVNTAQLDELKPGSYVFEIKACNEDDVCSEIEKLAFQIESPYYTRWWFLAMLFSILSFLIFITIRAYYRNIDKRNKRNAERIELEKEVYSAKISAIRAQMNPHFMFNALNTIQEFIITNQQEIATEYLADFADLMRMFLEQSKNERISLHDEIEALKIYLKLENLRFNEELDYEITADNQLNLYKVTIPVMLIQPFVENSVKHGLLHKRGKKRLKVIFKKVSKNKACCTIEDDGIGRKASERINSSKTMYHESFALKATAERLKWLNKNPDQDFSINTADLQEKGKALGTRVEVFFTINS